MTPELLLANIFFAFWYAFDTYFFALWGMALFVGLVWALTHFVAQR